MVGVEASPQSATVAPAATAPLTKAALTLGPDRRQSVPTATTGRSAPRVFLSQATNDRPIVSTTSGVRLTSSSSTPSSATPLISEPF